MARISNSVLAPRFDYESCKNCRPDLMVMKPADKIPDVVAVKIRGGGYREKLKENSNTF
jgi:hypothetical protein